MAEPITPEDQAKAIEGMVTIGGAVGAALGATAMIFHRKIQGRTAVATLLFAIVAGPVASSTASHHYPNWSVVMCSGCGIAVGLLSWALIASVSIFSEFLPAWLPKRAAKQIGMDIDPPLPPPPPSLPPGSMPMLSLPPTPVTDTGGKP